VVPVSTLSLTQSAAPWRPPRSGPMFGGAAVVIGYSAGRIAPVLLTDLIWTGASVRGFNLFFEPPARIAEAYGEVFSLAQRQAISPPIDRVAPLEDAVAALKYLIEGRPFGKVVLSVGASQ